MGVRGLQTYIERDCPEACKSVSVKEIADNHRNFYNCDPVLVVDGMSMINRLYQNTNLEWIYGGQWLQFVKILEDFISRFKNIGVSLVFFFDGTISAEKRDEWVKRRVSKYETIANIFQEIKFTLCEPHRQSFQLPTSMGTLTRFAMKELGAEVVQTDKDADEAIAEYANNHKEVCGILSQDSDFIIYNTKTYLSLLHLDFQSLRTIHYDRDCFANRYLKLSVSQLPLFACLNGNDFVPQEKLRGFHQQVSKNGRIYMAAIAENMAKVIRAKGWTGDPNNLPELERISLTLFGHPGSAITIQNGLKSYVIGINLPVPNVCIKVSPEFQRTVYAHHLKCLNTFIFNLLCKLEYESSEPLEDHAGGLPPSALLYRQIRQRCYGVIFNQYYPHPSEHTFRENERITVKEWCAYYGNYMVHPEYIQPLPLEFWEGPMPSIEDVWFKLTEEKKMKLFWSILQISMEFEVLNNIPKPFMVLACILHYLIIYLKQLGPLLEAWEVAVFVAQALMKKTPSELEKLKAPTVDARAVSLSTIFMRGVTTILLVHSACASPFPLTHAMPWNFFDGKLFHHLYIKANSQVTIYELCSGQEDTIKKFYELLSVITRNTAYDFRKMDWRNIFPDFTY